MKEFAYLHCHTIYSIQDGMATNKDYVNAIYEYNNKNTGYKCLGYAVTDHGYVSSFVKHYNACRNPDDKNKIIKDIYGCEIYHCKDIKNNPNKERYHLVLLAKNETGLSNLYKIVSHAGTHSIQGKTKTFPVTDINFLKDHGEGLICLTACVAGMIPQLIINGKEQETIDTILEFNKIFDELYLEVQPHNFAEQILVNHKMVELSQRLGLKLVMTPDSHYIYESDSKYHDILKDMSHQIKYTTNNRLYTPEEMELFCNKYNIPLESITNSAIIANKCNVDIKPKDHKALLPIYPCPSGYNESTYLRKLALESLKQKIIDKEIKEVEKYIHQMLYELDVICNAGFAGYFLILWDWFEWCRQNDILMGPGRGSAAGSIISYVLNITKVDPIKNGFFFERFLNKGRIEFPDIDSDVPRSKRADAIKYLLNRYGNENISQIITFGEYKLKNTVKAVLSALKVDFKESNEVTRNIPDLVDGKAVTYNMLEDVYNNPDKYSYLSDNEINGLRKNYESLLEVFKKYPIAYEAVKHVAGCLVSTGIHAGGVIVCNDKIKNHAGIINGSNTAVLPLIMFEMSDLDFFGFLKIDILGLKTLDVIKKTMELANLDYDWYDSEDYTDENVYQMLREGSTCDVFQMAKYTPTKMIYDFKTNCIEDLCAINAGNRPGPLEKDPNTNKSMVDNYIEAKQNGVIPSIHPLIDPVLKETMGSIWYQEQCMSIGQIMAGYDLGASDLRIRKTLGKKIVDKIPEIKNEFIYGKKSLFDENHKVIGISEEDSEYCIGSIAKGFDEELSKKVFESMESFAKYSFNKSHSFCYAVIAYKTAWLSYHYPKEFAVANCTVNDDQEKVTATLGLAKKRNINVLPPDINKSSNDFSINNNDIRYGLKAIKGLGISVLNFIRDYKKLDNFPFINFNDYYNRIHNNNPIVDKLIINLQKQTGKKTPNPMKKDVEVALILSGAFDYCENNRYKLLNHYIGNIRGENKVKVMGVERNIPIDEKLYMRKEKLALEKFYMGSYISEHPLDPFPYESFEDADENQIIRTSGLLNEVVLKSTKRGKDYLSLKFTPKDDIEISVNLFDEGKSQELRPLLKKNQIIIVKGRVSKTWKNINAQNISIVTFKKQDNAIDTEDLDVIDKTSDKTNNMLPVSDVGFSSIFD